MKTPEQMAEEYAEFGTQGVPDSIRKQQLMAKDRMAFLAGYHAAKDQLADAGKVMFCVHCNDMHKGDCAEGKGKNHAALRGTQWISVKERLPDEGEEVLIFGQYLNDIPKVLGVRSRYKGDQDWKYTWEGPDEWVYRENDVTHWMPLPEPPMETE